MPPNSGFLRRLRQYRPKDGPGEGGDHGLRHAGHPAYPPLPIERGQHPQQGGEGGVLQSAVLLPVLKLRLLLLRREEDGGKGEADEEKAAAIGTAATTG